MAKGCLARSVARAKGRVTGDDDDGSLVVDSDEGLGRCAPSVRADDQRWPQRPSTLVGRRGSRPARARSLRVPAVSRRVEARLLRARETHGGRTDQSPGPNEAAVCAASRISLPEAASASIACTPGHHRWLDRQPAEAGRPSAVPDFSPACVSKARTSSLGSAGARTGCCEASPVTRRQGSGFLRRLGTVEGGRVGERRRPIAEDVEQGRGRHRF